MTQITDSFSMFRWDALMDGPGYPLSFLTVDVPPLLKDVLDAQSFSAWYQFDSKYGNSGAFYYEVSLTCEEFPFLKYENHGHTYFVETAKARIEYLVSLFLEQVNVYTERVRVNAEAVEVGLEPLPIPDIQHERSLAEKGDPLTRADGPSLSAEHVAYKASQETLAGCLFIVGIAITAIIVGLVIGWLVFNHISPI